MHSKSQHYMSISIFVLWPLYTYYHWLGNRVGPRSIQNGNKNSV